MRSYGGVRVHRLHKGRKEGEGRGRGGKKAEMDERLKRQWNNTIDELGDG